MPSLSNNAPRVSAHSQKSLQESCGSCFLSDRRLDKSADQEPLHYQRPIPLQITTTSTNNPQNTPYANHGPPQSVWRMQHHKVFGGCNTTNQQLFTANSSDPNEKNSTDQAHSQTLSCAANSEQSNTTKQMTILHRIWILCGVPCWNMAYQALEFQGPDLITIHAA